MNTQRFRHTVLWPILLAALLLSVSNVAAEVTFDWATIGDTNNPADTLVMTKCPSTFCTGDGTSGYGSVAYEYQIARHHVTNSQYAEFLNSVDPNGTNDLELFDSRMEQFFHPVSFEPVAAWTGGIELEESAPAGARYSAKSGQENLPATWISWVSGARFVNWLSNGQGIGDTESGVYNNLPATSTDPIPVREAGATIFLPTENEFYKAAYYNPTLNAGAGGYTEYGVSNSPPVIEGPTGGANSANYAQTDGTDGPNGDSYWQNSGGSFDDSLDYRTEVDAYATATSHYGLFDVDGNAYQWLEASRPNQFGNGDLPLFRGGSWFHASDGNGAAFRNTQFFAAGSTSLSSNYHGIRIARLTAAVLAGDYNDDGTVNAADYVAWRDNLGAPAGALPNDADGGDIGPAQLETWKTNFGNTAAASAVSNVIPEPGSLMLMISGCIVAARRPSHGARFLGG